MCYIDQPDWLEPQFCHLQLCDPDLELSKPRILHLYNRGRNTLLSWQIMQCGWHDAWPLSAVIAESRTLDRGLHMFPWALLLQSPLPRPTNLTRRVQEARCHTWPGGVLWHGWKYFRSTLLPINVLSRIRGRQPWWLFILTTSQNRG